MKLAWDNGVTQLYQGDARTLDALVDESVDVIITDPPWPNGPAEERPWETWATAIKGFTQFTDRLVVVLGCNSDPRFLGAIPNTYQFFRVCWLEYVLPRYLGRLLYTSDIAYAFGRPPKKPSPTTLVPGRIVDTSSNRKQSAHPYPRKLAHMEWLVKWFSNEGETIPDPFCGSGTTLAAAQRLGRRSVGVDLSAEYLALAQKRLEGVPLPLLSDKRRL